MKRVGLRRRGRRLRNVDSSLMVDGEGEVAVLFASIDVGIGGGEDDPVGAGIADCLINFSWVAEVGVLRGAGAVSSSVLVR